MPTDEERREVAARLRGPYPRFRSLPEAFGFTGQVPIYELRYRLADLIEPEPGRTCRMVDNGVGLCCSVCGRRHGYDDEPDFCMGCGAKVVAD